MARFHYVCIIYVWMAALFGGDAATVYASHDTRYSGSYVVSARADVFISPPDQQWQPGLEKITNKLLKTYRVAGGSQDAPHFFVATIWA